MKQFYVFLVLGIGFSLCAFAQGEVTHTLPPIVIQAPKPEPSSTPPSPVRVQTGVGMKEIDSPLNEFGIELRNMEKLADISVERQQEGWFLSPLTRSQDWQTQCQVDLSLDQKIKARTFGSKWGLQVSTEGGIFRDHRPVSYMNNSGDPNTIVGNHLDTYPYKKEGG